VLFVTIVLGLAVGLQVPFVWALGRLGGHPFVVVAFALFVTAGFVAGVLGPRSVQGEPGPVRLYLVLWPFFIWWTIALLFAVMAPLALAAATLLHASTDTALATVGVLAVLGMLASVQQNPLLLEREVFVVDLPEAFAGYRIAQISDLHCGPFAGGRRVDAWVATVNRQAADLVAVTGDLIASGATFVPIVARALGALAARDGVFAVMGNHDYFTDGDAVALALERAGLTVLRNRGVEVRRGDASLYIAGVDDTWTGRHDVARALAERTVGAPVVLLAHDPALFPEAVHHGVDLTLSGHTHGGQVAVPLFARRFNLARIVTRFTSGMYREGASTLYVNRGLGTTGPPVRLAVAPEIAIITLRRAPAGTPATADAPVEATSRGRAAVHG
jgi:predicted MPP superfamily phosphohydrolase